MTVLRSALREALWVGVASLLLAAGYNGFTGKGVFGGSRGLNATPVGSSPSSAEIISIEQAKELFDLRSALFVDTRHAYDYNLGHIGGARNIPLKQASDLVASLPFEKGRTIVVYCDGAECNSSFEVAASFIAAGFANVRIFFAGWQSWSSAGYPVESESLETGSRK